MSLLKRLLVFFSIIICFQLESAGQISGQLVLDDTWDPKIYLSLIEDFKDEFTISNAYLLTSTEIDADGHFAIDLGALPETWSLLRLHVVKKEVTPNSLVIGSLNENFMFLIANKGSEINLKNTKELPIFGNVTIKGAPYMETFRYVKRLVDYPNALNYENTLIEKEFIVDAVEEKLRLIADTCSNPLVSLYALTQTDFQADFTQNEHFYKQYIGKWSSIDNPYFRTFQRNLPQKDTIAQSNQNTNSWLWWIAFGVVILCGVVALVLKKAKRPKENPLSVKEREVFDLLQKGLTNKEISEACNIELTTVKSHVSNIYTKLKIKSRKEAMDLRFD